VLSVLAMGPDSVGAQPPPPTPQPAEVAPRDWTAIEGSEDPLSAKEMDQTWRELANSSRWKALLSDLQEKGFGRAKGLTRQWGVRVGMKDGKGVAWKTLFCIWDFEHPTSKESGAVVYARKRRVSPGSSSQASDTYMAYIIVPAGRNDLDAAREWFVDATGKVAEAHSWKSCMKKNLVKTCSGPCVAAIPICVTAATTSGPFSPAAFLGCLAVICGSCLMIVNVVCAFS